MAIDPVAAGGFSSAASTYARIRPAYARGCIGLLADRVLRAAPGVGGAPEQGAAGDRRRVLDVGAGTGIMAGQLRRARLECWAVEPLAPMAAQLTLSLTDVPVALGAAERLPLRASSFDLVVAAQAFHWFEPADAVREAARVCRRGGALALVWNARDESVPWVHELTELVERRTGGRPYDGHHEHRWADVVESGGDFALDRTASFPNPIAATVTGVLDRLRSTSFVAALDPSSRAQLLDDAATLLAARPELGATFEFPHSTELLLFTRT